ncbi:PAS domain-containing hybrid sensor histidine kinase/response regulator [Lutibacter sp.]
MNLKKLFTIIHIALITLLIVLSVLTLLLFQNKTHVKNHNQAKLKSYAIASKLRKSSNNLTQYSRTYVLTGDSIWKKKYWKVLGVLNGEKPWSNGRVISWNDSVSKFPFLKEEVDKLKLSFQNINNLSYTEKKAINAFDGLFDDGTGNFTVKKSPNLFLARTIIFDDKYQEDKANIMELIEDFFVMYQKRVERDIKKHETISYILLGVINILIVIIIVISTISFFKIKNKIILQFEELKIAKEKAEEKERENRKLSVAVNQSASVIVITDIEGNIEYSNPKFTEVTGYSAKEVLGKNLRILKTNYHSKKFYAKMWQVIKSGNTWKGVFRNKSKKGKVFWEQATITPIKDVNNNIINFLSIKEDITESKKTMLTLKESERNLIEAQKIAKIGSFNLNLKTMLAKTSNNFDTITEFNLGEKTFAVWREITHPDDAQNNQKVLEKCIKENEKFDLEYRIITKKTKKIKWIHGLGEVIYKDGEPVNFVGTIQDITERKQIEQELLKAKKEAEEGNRLKTEFLNNMSHEIRTPMNGIIGFSEMLTEENITEAKRKYFINIIQNSGKQLLQIIDDILEISKLGTKQVKVIETKVCLNDVLLELFSVFDIKAKENNTPLYLKKSLSNEKSTVLIDKTKLIKILSNLLENALKFTNKGFIEIGYYLENEILKIYVKDTGVGIDSKNQKRIFDRFSQGDHKLSKKAGGLGLGLSIAKENTELLGGKISVQSKKGEGSTFIISIPYNPVNQNEKINKKESILEVKKKPSKYTILVAEDEEVNYLFIEIVLIDKIKLPCTILHAKNGQEAVDFCKNTTEIDLVLMDVKMPVLNGYEATKQIKEFLPELTIIAQTAYSTPNEIEKAFLAGCDDFISKPINKKTIVEIIDKYLLKQDKNNY